MPAGVVHRWFEDKGYGFIKPTDGGADVFVHVKGLLSADFLQVGDQVTFETKLNESTGKENAVRVVGGRKKATATLDQASDRGKDAAVRGPERPEKARGRKDEVAATEYQPMSVTRVDLQTPQELEVNLAQVACLQEIPGERDRCWMLYSTAVKAPERVAFEDDGTGEIDPLVGEPVGPKVLHAVQALGSYRDLKRAIERAVSGAGDWREVTRAQGMIITPGGLVLQRKRVVHEKLLVNFHFVAHTNRDLGGCEVVFLNIHLPPRLDILEAQIKHVGEEMEKLQYEQEQIKGDVTALGEEVQRQARELRRLAYQQQQQWQKMERQRVTVRRAVRTRRTSSVRGDCLPYIVLLPSADVLASGRFSRSQPSEQPEQPEPELEPCPAGRTCRTYPNCDRYHASLPSRAGAAAPSRKVLCHFGDNCARYPDCGFHHAQPPVIKTVQVAIDKSKTECMHGDTCKKWPQCEYLHKTVPAGKLCSFGDGCLRYPNCGYHHERPPQGAGVAGGAGGTGGAGGAGGAGSFGKAAFAQGAFAKGSFAKGGLAKGGLAKGGLAQGGKGGKRGPGTVAGFF